jgi:hypothetical protein
MESVIVAGPLVGKTIDRYSPRVIIATVALNLQGATRLINYDIHWNPMRLMQRIGRVNLRSNSDAGSITSSPVKPFCCQTALQRNAGGPFAWWWGGLVGHPRIELGTSVLSGLRSNRLS